MGRAHSVIRLVTFRDWPCMARFRDVRTMSLSISSRSIFESTNVKFDDTANSRSLGVRKFRPRRNSNSKP